MTYFTSVLIVLSFFVFFIPSVFARGGVRGLVLEPSFTVTRDTEDFTYAEESETNPEDTEVATTLWTKFNVGLGYSALQGIFIGGKLLYWTGTASSSSADFDPAGDLETDVTGKISFMGYGPTLGYYHARGFNFSFTYLLKADETVDGTINYTSTAGDSEIKTKTVDQKGGGYLFDIGYAFDFGNWALGPKLVYLAREYKGQEITTESTNAAGIVTETEIESKGSFKETSIQPYFGLWLYF